MTLSVLGRTYDNNVSHVLDMKSGRVTHRHTVKYLVRGTDCAEDEKFVPWTVGIPRLGDESTIYPGLFVESLESEEGEGNNVFTITVNYTNPDRELTDRPWDQPYNYSYDTTRKPSLKTRMIYLGHYSSERETDLVSTAFGWTADSSKYPDEAGNFTIDVTNSAGDPIYYDGERILVVCNIEFNALPEDVVYWLERVNTINSNVFFLSDEYPSVDPGKLLLDSFTAERVSHVDEAGELTYYFECKARVTHDPLGHWVEFADVGSRYYDPFRAPTSVKSDAQFFRDKNNEVITSELNGRGGPIESYESTFFLKYVPYPVKEW